MDGVWFGVRDQLLSNGRWMGWNLVLAVLPWVLTVALFRPRRRTSVAWWIGAAAVLALLPNAAYVLTDVIHLPRVVRGERSDAVVLAGILPMFGALFAVGFVAYVDALRRIGTWVVARGWTRRTWPVEVALHAASAVGIYAGRIHRFNSWDLALRPNVVVVQTLDGFTRPLPVAGMAITFAVLAIGSLMVRPMVHMATRVCTTSS